MPFSFWADTREEYSSPWINPVIVAGDFDRGTRDPFVTAFALHLSRVA